MTATAFETVLQLVKTTLVAAGTAAAGRVHRGLVDELDVDQAPAIVIRRDSTDATGQSIHVSDDEHQLTFTVSHVCTGADWETECDALHQAAHVALGAVPSLMEADLRLIGTSVTPRAGEPIVGSLSALYQVTTQTGPDLT